MCLHHSPWSWHITKKFSKASQFNLQELPGDFSQHQGGEECEGRWQQGPRGFFGSNRTWERSNQLLYLKIKWNFSISSCLDEMKLFWILGADDFLLANEPFKFHPVQINQTSTSVWTLGDLSRLGYPSGRLTQMPAIMGNNDMISGNDMISVLQLWDIMQQYKKKILHNLGAFWQYIYQAGFSAIDSNLKQHSRCFDSKLRVTGLP